MGSKLGYMIWELGETNFIEKVCELSKEWFPFGRKWLGLIGFLCVFLEMRKNGR